MMRLYKILSLFQKNKEILNLVRIGEFTLFIFIILNSYRDVKDLGIKQIYETYNL